MRKGTNYALIAIAAAAAMAAVTPMASHAAAHTYQISGGNGRAVVIGGTGMEGLQGILGQIGGSLDASGCLNPFPGLGGQNPGIQLPGIQNPDIPGGGVPDNSLPMPEYPVPDGSGDMGVPSGQDAMADEIVRLVNEERAKAGLSPLTVHAGAARAAQVRAREIETSFSHTRPDGSGFSTALREAGVGYRSSGENIAYGQRSAAQVMKDWMGSAGHRANILNGGFGSIGVGHHKNAVGVDYWTQIFVD